MHSISQFDAAIESGELRREPFSYVVVDNFMPEGVAKSSMDAFRSMDHPSWEKTRNEGIEVKNRSDWKSEFDITDGIINVVQIMNSADMLSAISRAVSIPKLIPDPYFCGGRLNVTERSGMLDVHLDGNYHAATGLNRRVNALLYLNPNWQEDWGGECGVHADDMETVVEAIAPLFNSLVVFDTHDKSYLGVPNPINFPESDPRRSIILYYDTVAPRPSEQIQVAEPHSALWRSKGLRDKRGNKTRDYTQSRTSALECDASSKPMNNVIIYAGGFGLPDRTGSAQRCSGNVALWQILGFEPVVLGKLPGTAAMGQVETFFNARCLDIRDPHGTGRGGDYRVDAKAIAEVAQEIGLERLRAVAVYNYPAVGLRAVLAWARANGVPVISDCTEWYPWEGTKVARNIFRQVDMLAKVHLLNRMAGNLILATNWMQKHYPSANTLIMPGVYDPQDARFAPVSRRDGPISFFYGGSPGVNQNKDRQGEFIHALAQLKDQGAVFRADIVGLSENQYLDVHPQDRKLVSGLGEHVCFWGRVPHSEALRLLKNADYSVFFRPLTRQNEAGFPGKYIEAVMAGVPVITNSTSDLAAYQRDGVNGFLSPGMDTPAIRETLQRALTLSSAETAALRARRDDKAFALELWRAPMTRFMEGLRPVASAAQALGQLRRVPLRKNTAMK